MWLEEKLGQEKLATVLYPEIRNALQCKPLSGVPYIGHSLRIENSAQWRKELGEGIKVALPALSNLHFWQLNNILTSKLKVEFLVYWYMKPILLASFLDIIGLTQSVPTWAICVHFETPLSCRRRQHREFNFEKSYYFLVQLHMLACLHIYIGFDSIICIFRLVTHFHLSASGSFSLITPEPLVVLSNFSIPSWSKKYVSRRSYDM
jgi:hypothetical protein